MLILLGDLREPNLHTRVLVLEGRDHRLVNGRLLGLTGNLEVDLYALLLVTFPVVVPGIGTGDGYEKHEHEEQQRQLLHHTSKVSTKNALWAAKNASTGGI